MEFYAPIRHLWVLMVGTTMSAMPNRVAMGAHHFPGSRLLDWDPDHDQTILDLLADTLRVTCM